MKVTQSSLYRNLLASLQDHSGRLQELSTQAASGKRLNRPSDEPVAIEPLLNGRSELLQNQRYQKTIETSQDRLAFADTQLGNAGNLLVRLKELSIGAINDSLSASERAVMADEVAHIRESMTSAANAKMAGRYIFSGYRESTAPFTGAPGVYNGDFGTVQLETGPGELSRVSLPGGEVFLGDGDGDGLTDPGAVDVFSLLTNVETALRADAPMGVQAELGNIDTAIDQLSRHRGQLGMMASRLDSSLANMADVEIDLQEMISRYEDADMLETLTGLTQQETAFQAAMSVTSRISKLSILDYL